MNKEAKYQKKVHKIIEYKLSYNLLMHKKNLTHFFFSYFWLNDTPVLESI